MSYGGWTMAHATYDDAYPKQPRSGCAGTFRVTDDDGKTPVWLECDGCRMVVTVPQATVRAEAPPPRPTEQLIPDRPASAAAGSWPF